jgi:uncharacterized membrane protein YcaP (DUF421 family)
MSQPVLFDSWESLLRVVLVGSLAYVALVAMLRVSGKRTLSKMNAFDLVVTVALGSTLATVLLDRSVPLSEGVVALALLICLQYGITGASLHSRRFRQLIKSEPSLLVADGQFLTDAMHRQRVTKEEVEAALREHGLQNIEAVACVVLETDGSLSVVRK